MQAPKTKVGSLEAGRRKSSNAPRANMQPKRQGTDSESAFTSPHRANRISKETSLKMGESKSSLSPASEKRRMGKVFDTESRIDQLQEDLKKAKEKLRASEASKRQAQQETEEAKRQLLAMSSELNESRKHLSELLASEDERIRELRKISQDRDRAWQSELEAVHRQHAMDSSALVSAINEIQKLKLQLEKVSESEDVQSRQVEFAHSENQRLRMELEEALSLVENLRAELSDCKDSEAQAMEVLSETQMKFEDANATIETLQSNGSKAINSLSFELKQSEDQVKSLEELVNKFNADMSNNTMDQTIEVDSPDTKLPEEYQEKERINQLQAELNSVRSALDAAELRYQEECIRTTLQIKNAYEQIDFTKAEACRKQAELEAELNKVIHETHLPNVPQGNKGIDSKIDKNELNNGESALVEDSHADVEELKAVLMDKETELQSIVEENKMLKMEMEGGVKKNRIKDRMINELEAAQAANLEMESELKRLKVQLDQWRKAAELAASMLSDDNDGKAIETTSYFDISYPIGSPFPYSNDLDDDSPKKKNANMLKKIGVLWKKGQK